MSRKFALAFALCTMFGAMAAAPASAAQTHSVTVSYAGLNLNSTAGATRMITRISTAARTVCGDHFGRMSLGDRADIRVCRTETEQNAVNTLNHPMVTAMYYHREPTIIVASN